MLSGDIKPINNDLDKEPTKETWEVFSMLSGYEDEKKIIKYINDNREKIDVNYVNNDIFYGKYMLVRAADAQYQSLMVKLFEYGAVLNDEIIKELSHDLILNPPLKEAKKLIDYLIRNGFPKEQLLNKTVIMISDFNLQLLKAILEYGVYVHITALHTLLEAYGVWRPGFSYSPDDVFFKMLDILLKNGADPNKKSDEGENAFDILKRFVPSIDQDKIRKILLNSVKAAKHQAAIMYRTIANAPENSHLHKVPHNLIPGIIEYATGFKKGEYPLRNQHRSRRARKMKRKTWRNRSH